MKRVEELWFAGNRRSDTLALTFYPPLKVLWFAGNRRSDTLRIPDSILRTRLWFAGNRRSDTLHPLQPPVIQGFVADCVNENSLLPRDSVALDIGF